MLKDKFLILINNNDLFVFYQRFMVGDSIYELYPNEERSEALEKREYSDIVITQIATERLQKMIMIFAQNELGMNPIKLFFPKELVIYKNTMDNMSQLAGNWKHQQDSLASEEDLPEYKKEYETLVLLMDTVEEIRLKEGIDLTLLNDYFAGGGQ